MGCFNDPAWESLWVGGGWLTRTTYIQLAGDGSKTISEVERDENPQCLRQERQILVT